MMFQKLFWVFFLHALFDSVMNTEGGLITDLRKLRGYANIMSNVAGKKSDTTFQQFQHSKSTYSLLNRFRFNYYLNNLCRNYLIII